MVGAGAAPSFRARDSRATALAWALCANVFGPEDFEELHVSHKSDLVTVLASNSGTYRRTKGASRCGHIVADNTRLAPANQHIIRLPLEIYNPNPQKALTTAFSGISSPLDAAHLLPEIRGSRTLIPHMCIS